MVEKIPAWRTAGPNDSLGRGAVVSYRGRPHLGREGGPFLLLVLLLVLGGAAQEGSTEKWRPIL